MIAIAAVAVLVVVVAGVGWARFSSSRAERRSLEGYEKTLDLLGDVAKRSDAVAEVHVPTEAELARPHVRPEPTPDFPAPARSAVRILPPAKVRLEPPVLPGSAGARLPVFGDVEPVLGGAPVEAPPGLDRPGAGREVAASANGAGAAAADIAAGGPPTELFAAGDPPTELFETVPAEGAAEDEDVPVFDFDDTSPGEGAVVPPGRLELARAAHAGGDRRVRRAATGAAAAVAVGAIAVGGWQLASHKTPTTTAGGSVVPTTLAPPASGGHAGTHAKTSTSPAKSTSTPATFQPTSTSTSIVTYQAPAGTYTVTFKATSGACWLGAQANADTTAYLQMWTLEPGQTASYKASGPLVIKIGAPHYISIEVNGKPVVLPGYVNPYDISFATSTATTA